MAKKRDVWTYDSKVGYKIVRSGFTNDQRSLHIPATLLRKTIVTFLLLAAFSSPQVAVSQPISSSEKACILLKPAELEAVLGGKIASPMTGTEAPFHKDAKHDHDGVLYMCNAGVGSRGVSLMYGTQPATAEGKKRGEAKGKAAMEKMRKTGYIIEERAFGEIKCFTILPRSNKPGPAYVVTSCGVAKGRYFFSLSVSPQSAKDVLPIEKLKPLAEKATARLP